MIRELFLFANFASIYLTIFYLILFLSHKEEKLKRVYYPITVVIPTYNEEKTIEKCISSILNQNYPKNLIKIIVVDDRSKDNTIRIVKEIAKKEKNIKLIVKKEHSGKVKSLNIALKHIKTELFMVLDADTFLHKDALKNAVKYFSLPNVAAVITSMKVYNDRGVLGKLQYVEYELSIFLRKLLSVLGSLNTTHGATIFKTSIVKSLGGFDENNLTEDMEIALRLKKNDYDVISALDSFSYTIVPENLKGYYKQRIRWYVGFLKNVYNYRDICFSFKNFKFSFFSTINNLLWTFFMILLLLLSAKEAFSYWKAQITILKETNFDVLYWLKLNYSSPFYINFYQLSLFYSFIIFIISFIYVLKISRESAKGIVSIPIYIFLSALLQGFLWLNSIAIAPFYGKKGWKA